MMPRTESQPIKIDGHQAELIRSARRSLALEIGDKGLLVRAPKLMPFNQITAFVKKKSDWIDRNLRPPLAPIKIAPGVIVLLRGYPTEIVFSPRSRGKVRPEQQRLHIPCLSPHLSKEEAVKRRLISWYRQSALQYARQRSIEMVQAMQLPSVSAKEITVRQYKRRWGSCNSQRHISLNWRLIMAPVHVFDYVICHELAHVRHFNHSRQFWKLVSLHQPDWQHSKQWLDQHGRSLYRF